MQEWPDAWRRRRATLLSTPPLTRTATLRLRPGNEQDKYCSSSWSCSTFLCAEVENGAAMEAKESGVAAARLVRVLLNPRVNDSLGGGRKGRDRETEEM